MNARRSIASSVVTLAAMLSLSLVAMAPVAHPLSQEPTPRDTPTPEATWTTTPTFTVTPADTNTPAPPPATNTPRPSSTPEPPEDTDEPTETRTPTTTATGTPGLTPVTPIIEKTSVPTYSYDGTMLPYTGVEATLPPVVPVDTVVAGGGDWVLVTATPVVLPTREPTPSVTATPTPSDRLGPQPPAGLVATAGNGVVVLEWSHGAEEDLNGYRVYRSTAQGSGYSKVVSVSRKLNRYIDNSVINETGYFYVVSAFDSAGNESPFSNEVSIVPSALKGMPSSGGAFEESVLTSAWAWALLLGITLLLLLGGRRAGQNSEA